LPSTTARLTTTSAISSRLGTSYMTSSMIFSNIERKARAPVPLVTACCARARRASRVTTRLDPLHRQQLIVLFDHRVSCLGQISISSSSVSASSAGDDRQPSNKLRNHAKGEQVLRLGMLQGLLGAILGRANLRGMETENFVAESPTDYFVQADKCATANKQNLFGIYLDVLLVRMFAASLRGERCNCCPPGFLATPAEHLLPIHPE